MDKRRVWDSFAVWADAFTVVLGFSDRYIVLAGSTVCVFRRFSFGIIIEDIMRQGLSVRKAFDVPGQCAYRFHPLDDFTLLFQLILPLLFPQQIQLKQAEAVKSFLLFGVTISRDPILVGLGIERAFVPEKVILSEIHKHRLLPACAFIIGA